MKLRNVSILISIFVLSSLVTSAHRLAASVEASPSALQPTLTVSFKPAYGYSPRRISARLSQSEVDVVRRLQKIADTWTSSSPSKNLLNWRIEPSASTSPTIAYATDVLTEAREILSDSTTSGNVQIPIIIGRSQSFIREQVAALGCQPSLTSSGGTYLMGATVCNRNVITINLTGYLFLRSLSQPLTAFMETRAEPKLSSLSYLIVDRNLASIAHEWTHVVRNRLSEGFVPDNEPAWFREGLAEVIAGLSQVRASQGRYRYVHFHIIRLRKFFDWTKICGLRVSAFRGDSQNSRGCEYLSGASAVELLIAKYGGIPKILELYADIRNTGDFFQSFANTYNMSLREFEQRADRYATYISQASALP